ncbi:hypothetical protein IWW37_001351 [Coemansia sp. RSA 2050]|nr:hypothetical protein IWW37_001351 [Coemansia sp. RSA 2050]KAJ2735837.1 hypothetical protein IW152_001309 [Coemansia sp. BCRC 34962]
MIRVLLVAVILLGSPLYSQGKVVFDDPLTNPDAAAAVSVLRHDWQVHPHTRAADEPPRIIAYSTETIRDDYSPRTKFIYNDCDSAELDKPNHGRYNQDDRPSHGSGESEYSVIAAAVDALEPHVAPARFSHEQYRPDNCQDSRSERLPAHFDDSNHDEPSHGRFMRDEGAVHGSEGKSEFPAAPRIPLPAVAIKGEEPGAIVKLGIPTQDYPYLQDHQEPRREQSVGSTPSVELGDSAPAPASKSQEPHHLQDAERRIMLKAIGIELAEAMIIPDILPPKFEPEFNISMNFNKPVEMGQLLTINDTKSEPTVEFDTQPGQIFTLAMIDPDSPSNGHHGYRSYRHFLVSNLEMSENSTSTVITTYQGPHPEFGTGSHRYALVVLKQQGRYNLTEADVPESRVRFDIVDWGKRHQMKPVAASYFMVKRNHVNEVS